MPTKLEIELAELREREKVLLKRLDVERSNKNFKCGCGKYHKIKELELICSYYRSGGDWDFSEYQIICPDTNNKNRLFFNSKYHVPWEKRQHYVCSAQTQFGHMYGKLFKSKIDDYETDKRGWWNSEYIDQNHDRFGIKLEQFDEDSFKKRKKK